MSARAFYADLGIDLPDRGGANLQVSCFAAPEAHRREDCHPSCSVHAETGVFNCFSCGAKGGPYDAAVALGKSPAEAMDRLRCHGLDGDDDHSPPPKPRAKTPSPRPSEDDLDRYRESLEANTGAVERLEALRGWSGEAMLGLGLDGERVVFAVRDAHGALVNLLRYQPDPARRNGRPKMLAETGCPRDLFPAPETLDGDVVWIVEGEPDAVAAHSLGLPATAIPGTNGWRPEWAGRFAGRRVVVALDCDRQGRDAAGKIARDLLDHAAEVRVLDLASTRDDGYDIGDLALEAADLDSGRGELRLALERMAATVDACEPPEPADGAGLLDDLAQFVRRFVVVSRAQAVVVALWIVHTHAIEAAETTPYLSITSAEKESGKTRLLEVLDALVARPWFTGRATAAVLVRKVDYERPTLLLDESDAAFKGEKDYAEALRGLLNTGYRIGGKASLCVGQGAGITYRDFSTFGAKAIAGIGELPDTVASRAVPIRLERRAPREHVELWRERRGREEAAPMRERTEAWTNAQGDALRQAEPEAPPELGDRAQDTAEPLLAIADLTGGEWPERARAALLELHGGRSVEVDSIGVRLVADVRAVFDTCGADRLATADLLEGLCALEEAPWSEWRQGKPLTAQGLANLLRPYRVRSGTVRVDDGPDGTAKGYKREQFEHAWERYLPSDRPSSRHNVTTHMGTGIAADPDPSQDRVVTDGETAENPHGERDVTDVTDRRPGEGAERPIPAVDDDNVVPFPTNAERPATAEEEAEIERLREKFGGHP